MSEIAEQTATSRRRWARPGGSHDRLVGFLGWLLPTAIGVLAAFLAIAPLTMRGDVSFLLDKDEVDVARERLRVNTPEYRGTDDAGRPFSLRAGSAVQRSAADPNVRLQDFTARIGLNDGPAELRAENGRYDMRAQTVDVEGPLAFTAADGYRLDTRDVAVDLNTQKVRGTGRVEGTMPLGTFSAGSMTADLPSRTVTLSGRARLRITQGVR